MSAAVIHLADYRQRRQRQAEPSWHWMAALCRRHDDRLTDWEREFVDLLATFREPTAKQREILRGCWAKVTAS